MAIDYSKTLLQTGLLLSLEQFLKDNIGNLNTALQSNIDTAMIVASDSPSKPGPVRVDHVQIGYFTEIWTLGQNAPVTSNGRPTGGPVRIMVSPPTSNSFSVQRRTTSESAGTGMTTTLSTDIFIYFHGDLWRDVNKDREIRNIVLAQSVATDWIRSTFSAGGGLKFLTNSYEMGCTPTINDPTGSDYLYDSYITTGNEGFATVNTGDNQVVHALHLIHSGVSPT